MHSRKNMFDTCICVYKLYVKFLPQVLQNNRVGQCRKMCTHHLLNCDTGLLNCDTEQNPDNTSISGEA